MRSSSHSLNAYFGTLEERDAFFERHISFASNFSRERPMLRGGAI